VTDNLTGLIWLKDLSCFTTSQNWGSALSAANSLASGVCGLTDGSKIGDWHLPNRNELWSLIDFGVSSPLSIPKLPSGHPFVGVHSNGFYWSSSSKGSDTTAACTVYMNEGSIGSSGKSSSFDFVWPVRPQPIVTPVTGTGYTITPNTPQYVSTSTQFIITPVGGCTLTGVGGTCGGTLNGTTFTTNLITASCTVIPECTFPLSVSVAGSGGGTVSSTPAGITCPSVACSSNFKSGDTVILNVFPDMNSVFGGWSGECSGNTDCSVLIDTTKSFNAAFTAADKVRVIGTATTP